MDSSPASSPWAEKLLREVFPDTEVAELVPRTGGELSAVYEVRCADPSHSAILKVYAPQWKWKQAKEIHVYGLLSALGNVDGLPVPDNGAYMRHQFTKKLAEFDGLGGERRLRDAVARRIDRDGALFDECTSAVLCHNDLHEGNVLVAQRSDGWRVTGVIDVENAIAADPLIDVAKTDYYSLGRGEPERAALLARYGPLPADGMARLELYKLYHALELWDWFRSIGTTGPLAGIAQDIARLAG